MTVDESPAAGVVPNSVEETDISQDITESSTNDESATGTTTQEIIPDRIFVGNLPYEVTEEQVRNLTPEFDVVSVEIPRKNYYNQHLNRYVLQSKGYGFITYVSADDAREAISSIVGKFISGREIYAKYALPQNKSKFIQQHGQQQHQQQQQQHQSQQQQPQQHQLHQHRIPSHSQPYPFHIQPNLRNGFPLPPGGNFYPAFIPVPMSSNSNGSNNSESNQNGTSNNNNSNYYYNEIPTGPVVNLPPIKFNDPNSITPFYPQKLELPPNLQQQTKFERRKKLENGKPSKLTIFIGNLDRNITHYELEEYLISKGLNKPIRIKIPKKNLQPEIYQMLKLNRVKIQNKGIGFVKFSTHDEQIKAIEICNGDIWNGKKLNVTIAINVEDEDEEAEAEEVEEVAEVGDVEVSNPAEDSDTEVEVVVSE
ncbi:hypothetical protein CANINC_000523 [Pichia inconspicua]|uniref:RRM domain-containing protein n=1 Tax=Pichia inconspicua TaxID=52247 RepID=A0A4T0X6C2_9ASCO|nr:hypothetical protein CANINC_000523 [[Candida] inconspicua]